MHIASLRPLIAEAEYGLRRDGEGDGASCSDIPNFRSMKSATTVDEYIAAFPPEIQALLRQIRTVIRQAAPDAVEGIAYQMPAYKLNKKPLVYFVAFPKHIGFYATPTGHEAFAKELSAYKQGKGSVQFPLDRPIPLGLIRRIVLFRVKENR